jgi:hypothetical protein
MLESPRAAYAALMLAALFTAACDSTGPDTRRIFLEELARQEAIWADVGPASYTIEMTRRCNCPDTAMVRLEVTNDVVLAGTHIATGVELTPAELLTQYTVLDLFDVARDALNRGVASMTVSYDPVYGYVNLLLVDYDARRNTDDLIITVDDFMEGTGGS